MRKGLEENMETPFLFARGQSRTALALTILALDDPQKKVSVAVAPVPPKHKDLPEARYPLCTTLVLPPTTLLFQNG